LNTYAAFGTCISLSDPMVVSRVTIILAQFVLESVRVDFVSNAIILRSSFLKSEGPVPIVLGISIQPVLFLVSGAFKPDAGSQSILLYVRRFVLQPTRNNKLTSGESSLLSTMAFGQWISIDNKTIYKNLVTSLFNLHYI
jgi:hypothetical protein